MSVCGIRHQYSLPEHVKMSLFASEFLCDIEDYLTLKGNSNILLVYFNRTLFTAGHIINNNVNFFEISWMFETI